MNELLKDIFNLALVFLIVWFGFYLYTRHDTLAEKTAKYNCDLTEFMAKTPDDVKNECRRIKIETINNQKD